MMCHKSIVLLLLIVGISSLGCRESISVSGFNTTRAEFEEKKFHSVNLPPVGRDFNFLSRLDLTAVDFAISEQEFLAWSKKEQWVVEKISDSATSLRAARDEKIEATLVTAGWIFDGQQPSGSGSVIIYNRNDGRCSLFYGTR